MSITIATGTSLQVGKTYGAALVISSITNAAEAVATFVDASTISPGDYLEISSSWGRLDKKVVRVKTKSTNAVTLENINTTDTAKYAGSGSGSARRITAWDTLSQIKSMSPSGGDIKFADISSMDDFVDKQVPVGRSASALGLVIYDDPTLAWYATLTAASDSLTPSAMMMVFPNGSRTVANAYWSLSKTPDIAKDEAITAKLDLSFAAEAVRYNT
jgi:hypothetical protein